MYIYVCDDLSENIPMHLFRSVYVEVHQYLHFHYVSYTYAHCIVWWLVSKPYYAPLELCVCTSTSMFTCFRCVFYLCTFNFNCVKTCLQTILCTFGAVLMQKYISVHLFTLCVLHIYILLRDDLCKQFLMHLWSCIIAQVPVFLLTIKRVWETHCSYHYCPTQLYYDGIC